MLRNVPIRSKLLATLVGPLIVLTILALVGIRSNLADSREAGRVNQLARLAGSLAPLIHELQGERSLSASYIAGQRQRGLGELVAQRQAVDRVAAAYRAEAGRLDVARDDQRLKDKIEYGLRELGRLPEQRQAIDTARIVKGERVEPRLEAHEEEGEEHLEGDHGAMDTPVKALDQYTDSINDLLDINTEIAPGTNNEVLQKAVAASVALARAKDFADLQRGLLNDVFSAGRFQPGQYGKLATIIAAEDVYTAQFYNNASPEQHEFMEQAVERPEVERVEQLKDEALEHENDRRLGVRPATWFAAASTKLDMLRKVEERTSADVVAASSAIQAGANRRALLFSLLLAGALLGAIALLLITAGALIRPLARLKDAADEASERTLPGIVQRLQAGQDVDLAAESATPIELDSRDELGQLARSFNSVHRVAVQVAGKEASLRRSVSEMFLNLARRSQSLIERQLEVIDALGQQQPHPRVLEGLTELDHLATRMRRNAASLIVLSGAESTRRWQGPVPVADVVQAAAGEVKEQGRMELMVEDARIVGHAAADVVHLLAELIENAMSFSAPGTQVVVAGQALPRGYLLEIEDQGLGMTDEELVSANQRLTEPPLVDFARVQMLGFIVVGHLATRHGIKVQLRHSWYGGITALVLLPPSLVSPSVDADLTGGIPERERLPGMAGQAGPDGGGQPLLDTVGPAWFDDLTPRVHLPLRPHPTRSVTPTGPHRHARPRREAGPEHPG